MSEKQKLGKEPAFPMVNSEGLPGDLSIVNCNPANSSVGMSKRFYAACAAMQGLLSNSFVNTVLSQNPEVQNTEVVNKAYAIADELLKQENE